MKNVTKATVQLKDETVTVELTGTEILVSSETVKTAEIFMRNIIRMMSQNMKVTEQ